MIMKVIVGLLVLAIICVFSYFSSQSRDRQEWVRDFFKVFGISYVIVAVCAVVVFFFLLAAIYLRDALMWLIQAIFFVPFFQYLFT